MTLKYLVNPISTINYLLLETRYIFIVKNMTYFDLNTRKWKELIARRTKILK